MKTNSTYKPESRTIVLLTALAIGLGLAVSKVFFAIAAAIALSVPFGRLVDYLRKTVETNTPRQRHV
jgi:hypothetical protein